MGEKKKTIALIGDIHGNLPALKAVLDWAEKSGADEIWNNGDFLGYGPFAEETVSLCSQKCDVNVIGNYDLKVLDFPKKKKKWKKSKHPQKYLAFEWAYENISKDSFAWLKALPQAVSKKVFGFNVLITHGSPASVDEGIGRDMPRGRLEELAAITDADIVISGHTHLPFFEQAGQVSFINPGAVGRPEGGDPRACAALVHFVEDSFRVEQVRLEYDIERLERALHAAKMPAEFTQMFRKGKNLDEVYAEQERTNAEPNEEYEKKIQSVRNFATKYIYEPGHIQQVERLALNIFDSLGRDHHLGADSRLLLHSAAILHDIGWVKGARGHNKTAMEIILGDTTMPFDDSQRKIVALLARYHRKAIPKKNHKAYKELDVKGQNLVSVLGGILRVADGLDRTHRDIVRDVRPHFNNGRLILECKTKGPALEEMVTAQKKADLLKRAFKREIVILSR